MELSPDITITKVMNKILGAKGDIIRVRFSVDERNFEAYVPDDGKWLRIKDVLLNRSTNTHMFREHSPLWSLFLLQSLGGMVLPPFLTPSYIKVEAEKTAKTG